MVSIKAKITLLVAVVFLLGNLAIPVNISLAAATPTFVQGIGTSSGSGSASSATAKFNSNTTSGNLIIVAVGFLGTGTQSVSSVTDTAGDSFTAATSISLIPSGQSANYALQIWYAKNITGATAPTVTVNMSAAVTFRRVLIHEYSGLDAVSPLDSVSTNSATTSAAGTATSNAATASAGNDLVFGWVASNNGLTTAGSGFTIRVNAGSETTEDMVAVSSGSYAATWPIASADQYAAQAVTFKAAASGGGGGGGDVTAPSIPAGLNATAVSSSGINLSWTASTDNVGVTGYTIYRGGVQVGTSATNSYSDAGLTASTQYTYTVDAFDAAGNHSAQSSSASATTQAQQQGGSGNIYVTTSGNDSTCVRGDSSHPCLTFQGAYNKALAGDTIQVAAGTYVAQSVKGTLSTPVVKFVGVANSTILASLYVTGNNLEFDNMTAKYDATSLHPGEIDVGNFQDTGYNTNNITIVNGVAQTMFIVAVNGVNINGGSYGNYDPCQSTATNEDGIDVWVVNSGLSTQHVTFNGITMHDVTDHGNECAGLPGANRHVDCIQFLAGHFITIENSRFYNCPTDNFIMRPYLDTLDNITVQNNFFGPVMNPGNGELMGGTGDAVGGTNIYQYNTSLGSGPNTGSSNFIFRGNIMPEYACVPATYSYNVFWTGVGCGTHAVTGFPLSSLISNPNPSWNNGLVPNYNLVSNSTLAHGAGDPVNFPATDINGNARVAPIDAGAMQFSSSGGGDVTAPSTPTGLSATAVSSSGINLSWTASTDNVGVTGYKIYRGGVQVGTSATNSYSDTGLTAGTLYSYTVSAYDAAGNNSTQSSSASATTTSALDTTAPIVSITSPSAGTVSGTVTFSGTASDPTVTGQVTSGLKLVTLSVDGSVFATSTTGNVSKSLDTTTLTNASHSLTAIATDNAGNNSTVSNVNIIVNNAAAQKFPRTIQLTSLEGVSTIPANQAVTVTILSGSTVLETQSNLITTSGKYTVTFLSSDPQLVNIRVKANGYLSQLLTSVDTTVNSGTALSVPQLLAGDSNNDNVVNSLDYSAMNSNWLKTSTASDINGDGIVNSLDFAILKNNFNKAGN